ncbi:hypothetical protein [Defluviitalea phaphyphila]|uniref:hypothetical protein n=1 Tax=Defluviitalea phaphyphila TaxID=1473580 RepID=UPI00072FA52C|nr:hypothetical protein [Defluviitalea phaphyphila]
MKKINKIATGVIMTLLMTSSTFVSAAPTKTNEIETIVPRGAYEKNIITQSIGGIVPLGGTGYVDAYKTVSDTSYLYTAGAKTKSYLTLKVLNGHFYSDIGGHKSVYFDRDNSGIYLSEGNCSIISGVPEWESHDGNRWFDEIIRVQGNEEDISYSAKLTLNEALEILNTGGLKLSLPKVGEISTESQLRTVFSGSTEVSFDVTMTSDFREYYYAKLEILGIGLIDFTLDQN